VARFVRECSALGIERLWPAIQDISKLHTSIGFADPTLGGPAALAISGVAEIPPPRSWPDDRKKGFGLLPYDVQVYVAVHERRREQALRRAQNDAAMCRRKLAEYERITSRTSQGDDENEERARA
jgi:hypothetical protein